MLEGAEVHVHADAPVAGAVQGRLDLASAEVPETGALQKPGQIAQQLVEPLLTLLGG
jgi:hypothetical protein